LIFTMMRKLTQLSPPRETGGARLERDLTRIFPGLGYTQEMRKNKPTVMMVDDEIDYTAIIRAWLDEDYLFYGFSTGEEFLASVAAIMPDAVILDLYLMGVDGIELSRRLRELPGRKSVPVMFLTGSDRLEDYRRTLTAPGSTFLTKPVSRARLAAALDEMLQKPAFHDEGGGD
jgi:CheY-like chemotaxis protein